jgi:BirA family biotin operon repressor/biotin-[acetyl-CoA-carboxylase] ligase
MNDFSSFRERSENSKNPFVGEIILLDEVDSTNDYAKSFLGQHSEPENTVIVADRQLKGKGRMGRVWDSPPGMGLWMSFILKPELRPDRFFLYTFMAAVAAAEAIEAISDLAVELKWPNDLLLSQKKCGGILLESVTKNGTPYLIVGMGINVHQPDFPEGLRSHATSLFIESNRIWDRYELFDKIMTAMHNHNGVLDESILEKWKSRSAMFHRNVTIIQSDKSYEAVAKDLANDGALIIEREGKMQKIYAADVRVQI